VSNSSCTSGAAAGRFVGDLADDVGPGFDDDGGGLVLFRFWGPCLRLKLRLDSRLDSGKVDFAEGRVTDSAGG